jgi:hypothetical protein
MFDKMKVLLDKIPYSNCCWNVCVDLKVVNGAVTKSFVILCKSGKNRNETFTKNVVNPPLTDSEKIVYCHTMWIELGLIFSYI